MKNKTPWVWQNFWEGLADEALLDVKAPASRVRERKSKRKARLGDERLPDPRPLLHGDAIDNITASCPFENGDSGASLPERHDYIVVDENCDEGNAAPDCTLPEGPPAVQKVSKWKPDDQEALNPRWSRLADSFKDLGLQ